MSKVLILLLFVSIFTACGNSDNAYEDENIESQDGTEINDQEPTDDELSFELTPEASETGKNTVRDVIACGDLIVACGELSEKGYVTAYKNGEKIWENSSDEYLTQSYNTLACFNDEVIYAAGDRYETAASSLTAFIQALDMEGSIKWDKTLDNGTSVSFYAVTADSEGSVFAGGRVDGSLNDIASAGGKDGFITKFDSDGNLIFTVLIGTPVFDTIQALAVGSDGFVIAAGHTAGDITTNEETNDSESGMKGFIVKLKSDGTIYWKKMYKADMFLDISVFQTNSFYIAGNITKDGVSQAVAFQADLNGNIKSTYILKAEKDLRVTGIAGDSEKNVYITGYLDGNFSEGSRILPFTSDIPANSNVFLGILASSGGNLLYSGLLGGDGYDVNPKVAVDSSSVPHLFYYSLAESTDSSGTVTMVRFERE